MTFRRYLPVVVAALAASGVAALGTLMTDLGPWYAELRKPSWQPPDWLFGPAWTLIFALAAASGVYAWRGERTRSKREWVIGLFALNGALNVLWSALFFRLHHPDWALVEVPFFWLSILLVMAGVAAASATAAWLLVPYLAWVAFAALLNLSVVRLNFGLSWL